MRSRWEVTATTAEVVQAEEVGVAPDLVMEEDMVVKAVTKSPVCLLILPLRRIRKECDTTKWEQQCGTKKQPVVRYPR